MGEVSLYFLLPRNPDDIFPPPPPPPPPAAAAAAAAAPIFNVQPIAVPNDIVTSPQQQQLQIDPATLAQMLQQNPALMQTMAVALSQQQQQHK